MQFVNATIAVVLLVLALAVREGGAAVMFIVGAALAAIAFKHWLSVWMVRVLALFTAGSMFYFFWNFFALVPTLQPDWYWQPVEVIDAFGLLCAGFAMIPVLSEYSCRMKANAQCERGRRAPSEGQAPRSSRLLPSLRPSQTSPQTSRSVP